MLISTGRQARRAPARLAPLSRSIRPRGVRAAAPRPEDRSRRAGRPAPPSGPSAAVRANSARFMSASPDRPTREPCHPSPWAREAPTAAGAAGPQQGSEAVGGVPGAEGSKYRNGPVLRGADLSMVSLPGLGELDHGRAATARRSPPLSANTEAISPTARAGGSSATKCRTSLVATRRSVEEWAQSARTTLSPCSTPPSE